MPSLLHCCLYKGSAGQVAKLFNLKNIGAPNRKQAVNRAKLLQKLFSATNTTKSHCNYQVIQKREQDQIMAEY